MTETTKKLEISPIELDLIANALETQSKILCMQASAGGHGALARLNEVKRVLATIASHREDTSPPPYREYRVVGAYALHASGDLIL